MSTQTNHDPESSGESDYTSEYSSEYSEDGDSYTDQSGEEEEYTDGDMDQSEGEEGDTNDDKDQSEGEEEEYTDGDMDQSGEEEEYTDGDMDQSGDEGEYTDGDVTADDDVTHSESDYTTDASYTEDDEEDTAAPRPAPLAPLSQAPLPDSRSMSEYTDSSSEGSGGEEGEDPGTRVSDTSGIATDLTDSSASPSNRHDTCYHGNTTLSAARSSDSIADNHGNVIGSCENVTGNHGNMMGSCESLGGLLETTSLEIMSEEEIRQMFARAHSPSGTLTSDTPPGPSPRDGRSPKVSPTQEDTTTAAGTGEEGSVITRQVTGAGHSYYRRSSYRQFQQGQSRPSPSPRVSNLRGVPRAGESGMNRALSHISAVKLAEFDTAPTLTSPKRDVISRCADVTDDDDVTSRDSSPDVILKNRGRTVITSPPVPAKRPSIQANNYSQVKRKPSIARKPPVYKRPAPMATVIPSIRVTQHTGYHSNPDNSDSKHTLVPSTISSMQASHSNHGDTHAEHGNHGDHDDEKEEKRAKKRVRVIQEILHTEETYQNHLRLIIQLFEEPLREREIIPGHVIVTIFSNIRQIMSVNLELFQHLTTHEIGAAFLLLGPFLKLYSTYANNHERALATMIEWDQKSKEFADFRRQQEEVDEMAGLKLNALLITPVQRVPRYKLLLEELLDNTNADHPDYSAIQEAVEQITSVANHINEHIRQQENFMKMLAIQKSLSGHGAPRLLTPGRIFIKEGNLKKVSQKGGRSHERRFYLFSDMLMYAKPRLLDGGRQSYTCCCLLPLQHCRVYTVFGHSQGKGALFTVECKNESLLLYSDQKTVDSWMEVLTSAINKFREHRQTLRKASSAKQPLRKAGLAQLRKKQKQSDPLTAAVRNSVEKVPSPNHRSLRDFITSPISLMRRHHGHHGSSNQGDEEGDASPDLRSRKRVLRESGNHTTSPGRESSTGESSARRTLIRCLSPRRKAARKEGSPGPLSVLSRGKDGDIFRISGCFKHKKNKTRPVISEPTLCDMPDTMPVPHIPDIPSPTAGIIPDYTSPLPEMTSPLPGEPARRLGDLSMIQETSYLSPGSPAYTPGRGGRDGPGDSLLSPSQDRSPAVTDRLMSCLKGLNLCGLTGSKDTYFKHKSDKHDKSYGAYKNPRDKYIW